MEVMQIEGVAERAAITALCLDPIVLAAFAPTWEDGSFSSKWANIVARWAVTYYNQYRAAPGAEGVTALYADWAAGADEATSDIVSRFLQTLEPETGVASDYAINQIQKIITRVSTKRLADKIQGALSNGKVEEAAALVEEWRRPASATQLDYLSVFEHTEAVDADLKAAEAQPLITYPGAFGQFINPLLTREALVAFLAPAKRGKSTILLDIAWRSAMQGRNTVFIATGDMSRGQILDRLRVKASKCPIIPGTFRIPTSLSYENKEAKLLYKTRSSTVSARDADSSVFTKYASDDRFRLISKSAGSVSAGDIAGLIERWADQGWVADVVVIDYADVLKGMGYSKETRDQINENWIAMSALRTDMRCLVVTATQADTEGMDAWCLSMRNFNGDRRKWDHVTAAIGINCTPSEKKQGVVRFNHLALREGDFAADLPPLVAVAGCTRVGCPIILSEWV